MEIIAIEEMRAFLKTTLRQYESPILVISSQMFPGCQKCMSAARVLYTSVMEKTNLQSMDVESLIEIQNHKFPFPIYYQHSPHQKLRSEISKIYIGTKKDTETQQLEMVIRRIIEK